MNSILFISILILLVNGYHAKEEMGLEGFAPCEESVLSMNRLIGGPPQLDNYWDGVLNLEKWSNIPEVQISLTVNNPAKIELDENLGRVLVEGRTFHITAFEKPPAIDKVKFKIRGHVNGGFPNVEKLTLNGLDICKNPRQWKPSILKSGRKVGETTEDPDNKKHTCGRRLAQYKNFITNGVASEEGDWPWHAAIFHIHKTTMQYKCGGTLLNSNTILTSAHCVYENDRLLISERIIVQLGKHNLKEFGTHTQEFQVHKVVPHPDFNTFNLSNDIAIIRLATEATLTNYVQPICLWDSNKVALSEVIHKFGTVVGWGVTETGQVSANLRQAIIPIVPLTTCLISNRDIFGNFLSDKNFCAGSRNGTGPCNGESGGSIIFEENGVYRIRGILSVIVARADQHMCDSNEYVLFTDVAQYLTWIEETIAHTNQSPPIPQSN